MRDEGWRMEEGWRRFIVQSAVERCNEFDQIETEGDDKSNRRSTLKSKSQSKSSQLGVSKRNMAPFHNGKQKKQRLMVMDGWWDGGMDWDGMDGTELLIHDSII